MTDRLTAAQRSRNMSLIRGTDTRPELEVRRFLHAAGYRFRLHARHLPGRPDIVLSRYRTVIFVHGCFWHRHADCALAYKPKTRAKFWEEKLTGNVARDRRQIEALLVSGWRVITVWECALRGNSRKASALRILNEALASEHWRRHQEIPIRQTFGVACEAATASGKMPSNLASMSGGPR